MFLLPRCSLMDCLMYSSLSMTYGPRFLSVAWQTICWYSFTRSLRARRCRGRRLNRRNDWSDWRWWLMIVSKLENAKAYSSLHGSGFHVVFLYNLGLKVGSGLLLCVRSRWHLRSNDLLNFFRPVHMSWYGRGLSIQNFNPLPSRDAVPGGSFVLLSQRLWNAAFRIEEENKFLLSN